MRRGKKYVEALQQIDRTNLYSFEEAVTLVKKFAFAKFDETVDLSLNLSLKKSQSVRDTVVLPNQFSAEKKVLVFAKGKRPKRPSMPVPPMWAISTLLRRLERGG